ncbi:MAG: hypothetical protein ABH803_00560 [Candidatus Micrarchaeota archaeon]
MDFRKINWMQASLLLLVIIAIASISLAFLQIDANSNETKSLVHQAQSNLESSDKGFTTIPVQDYSVILNFSIAALLTGFALGYLAKGFLD